jgi:1-acyl-sn-glycerol-3-phosphate acyltransferase
VTARRRLRAVVRLAHAVVHGLHGLAIVLFAFRSLDRAGRHRRIAWWSRKMLAVLGIALDHDGDPIQERCLLVANHVSWLDIMAVHAVVPQARFVSKADVKAWPLIARLVDSAGTIYLERERKRDALRVVHAVAAALGAGEVVAIFPEGTTSTGHGLLPFHANLLQAAVATSTPVQPVALRFSEAGNPVSEAVEFIGATSLLQSLWRTSCGDGVQARLTFLAPRDSTGADRRVLAEELRGDIAEALGVSLGVAPGASVDEGNADAAPAPG